MPNFIRFTIVAVIAAVAMYYTPDQIDRIIELCLAGLGISKLVISEEQKGESLFVL